jgi:hypothetical protein
MVDDDDDYNDLHTNPHTIVMLRNKKMLMNK